uniref:ORF133 n=1 Tax=Cydia pomonella granulosis virus TaxID=28289 RepID=A0A5B8GPW0_GVCP|nr:ORF133 [Cydia pomonella granulovirus]
MKNMFVQLVVGVFLLATSVLGAPINTAEDYKRASLIVNAVSCGLQIVEVLIVIAVALHKIKQ